MPVALRPAHDVSTEFALPSKLRIDRPFFTIFAVLIAVLLLGSLIAMTPSDPDTTAILSITGP